MLLWCTRLVLVQKSGCLLGATADTIIGVRLEQRGESLFEKIVIALVDGIEVRLDIVDAPLGSPGILENHSRASDCYEWDQVHSEVWERGAGFYGRREPLRFIPKQAHVFE